MKVSIIEFIISKINETGKPIDLKEVINEIGIDNYNFSSESEMLATIYTDLMVDGRFVMVEEMWDLQEKYTINEINQHRSMQLGTTISEYLDEDGEIIIPSEEDEEEVVTLSTDDDDFISDDSLSDFLSEDDLEDD